MSRGSETLEHGGVRRDLEQALREFGTPVTPVDDPEVARARRDRTVSHLRALQARAVVRGQDARRWRKRFLVAALVLFPTGALAATWAVLREPSRTGERAARQDEKGLPAVVVGIRGAGRHGPEHAQTPPLVSPSSEATSEPASVQLAAEAREAALAPALAGMGSVRKASRKAPAAIVGERAADLSPVAGTAASAPSFKSFPDGAGQAAAASTLAAENALLQSAMGAARAGDDSGAILRFSDFLVRYPRSPLAENASVERSRALSRLRMGRSPLGDSLHP